MAPSQIAFCRQVASLPGCGPRLRAPPCCCPWRGTHVPHVGAVPKHTNWVASQQVCGLPFSPLPPAHLPAPGDAVPPRQIANISRIMKKALPANAKVAKDAKELVQECVSEFISFITSE